MSDSTRDLLVHGIAAAKANDKNEARYFLEWLLRDDTADREEQIEAYRWLAEISDDPKEKRDRLEQVLAYEPTDPEARRALLILNGQLNPADIVNPDQPPAPSETTKPISARRFVCPKCGGRMAFDPGDTSLTCQYCGNHQSLLSAMDSGAMLEEQDFAVALATNLGHSVPVTSHIIKCTGCSASFQFTPEMLSHDCAFCGTPYVVEQTSTRDLIAPEGIVPFFITRDQAQRAAVDWYKKNKFKVLSANALPNGVYLPVWAFDMGGVIDWSCVVEIGDKWLPQSGAALASQDNVLVSATHSISAELTSLIDDFPLLRLVRYDARYLADWTAETYTVQVGDASIVARSRVIAKTQPVIQAGITNRFQHLQFNTLKLVINSYKLILLPFWIARYHWDGKWYNIAINGLNGTVRGEKPLRGVSRWLSSLINT